MKIAIISVTKGGIATGYQIQNALSEHDVTIFGKKEYISKEDVELIFPLGKFVGKLFKNFESLIFVTATGVALRSVAKHLKGKEVDPTVVVVDEMAKHVISLLSGHHGANELARDIASRIGADAVITTSTEVQGKVPVETLAKKLNLVIEDYRYLKEVNAAIANDNKVDLFSEIDFNLNLPDLNLKPWAALEESKNPKIVITNKLIKLDGPTVYLRPKNLILGIGARKNLNKDRLLEAIKKGLIIGKFSINSIKALATVDFRAKEKGFKDLVKSLNVPLIDISISAIREVEDNYKSSAYVKEKIGVGAVCEPCAVLAGNMASLVLNKTKLQGITLAVAEENENIGDVNTMKSKKGKIYIVGLGPGGKDHLTPKAVQALDQSDVIVTYKGYLPFIPDITGKEVFAKGMGGEVKRSKIALDKANEGSIVSVVSSGDPGVYAMASVVLECAKETNVNPDIEIVPGITAANSAAALLGAPIGHDFAVLSLSDLLTPWEVIVERLENAAKADFCIVLYNPRSRGRRTHLDRAVEILKKYRSSTTPTGIIRDAMREEESVIITTLGELLEHEVDMHSTVIIGNSESFIYNSWIVTPRGYKGKYFKDMK
tara:strand:+ start:6108 stop:7913 length:1806 start_codon:yes stop_codon:yes gene_type:complete